MLTTRTRSTFVAASLVIGVCGIFASSCTTGPEQQPRVAVQSECAQIVIACYDGFARQPVNLACFRPASRWPRRTLTWNMVNPVASIDEATQRAVAADAFQLWAEASALEFVQVGAGEDADISIHFDSGEENGAFPFDGPGGYLGLAYFPGSPRPGDIYLSDIETWTVPPSEAPYILHVVLVHEIGHALGLEHSLEPGSIMEPSYSGPIGGLHPADVESIQRLYGSADGSVAPLEVLPPNECESFGALTALGDPDTDGDGIPDTIEIQVLGTDPLTADTDEDGDDDFVEVFVLGRPPTDIGPDRDGDMLPDAAEAVVGTDADDPDTDDDELTDGIEVLVLGTDPLSADTDDDGFADGDDPWPTFPELPVDCDGNGVADDDEPFVDCNENGVRDACDVAFGDSEDCQDNGIPDECEIDCNGNGIPDECDIAIEDSADCNGNGVPDECDLESGAGADCDGNGLLDGCEIASGDAEDCNENGVLDFCEFAFGNATDCNTNGVLDECDIASGESADCNTNLLPDECDIAFEISEDCDGNDVPDECDIRTRDCDGNGVVDVCDILSGIAADCNGNLLPDSCDIADGVSADCQPNGVPDDCEIALDPDLDLFPQNGIPDECETAP